MKETITESRFIDMFNARRPNQFTYEGLTALFEHLEEFEDATGEEIELDVIGLFCDYCEYDNLKEFNDEYGEEYETIEDVENETIVIPINEESFIIAVF